MEIKFLKPTRLNEKRTRLPTLTLFHIYIQCIHSLHMMFIQLKI